MRCSIGLAGSSGTWFLSGHDAPGLTYLKPQLPAALKSPWRSQDLCVSPMHPNTCNLSSETPCPRPIAPSKLAFPRGTPHQNSSPPDLRSPKLGGRHPTGSGWGPRSLLTILLSHLYVALSCALQIPLASSPDPTWLFGKVSRFPSLPGEAHLPL